MTAVMRLSDKYTGMINRRDSDSPASYSPTAYLPFSDGDPITAEYVSAYFFVLMRISKTDADEKSLVIRISSQYVKWDDIAKKNSALISEGHN